MCGDTEGHSAKPEVKVEISRFHSSPAKKAKEKRTLVKSPDNDSLASISGRSLELALAGEVEDNFGGVRLGRVPNSLRDSVF
jgi:hypothetical protein